jgi:hypothetical protein
MKGVINLCRGTVEVIIHLEVYQPVQTTKPNTRSHRSHPTHNGLTTDSVSPCASSPNAGYDLLSATTISPYSSTRDSAPDFPSFITPTPQKTITLSLSPQSQQNAPNNLSKPFSQLYDETKQDLRQNHKTGLQQSAQGEIFCPESTTFSLDPRREESWNSNYEAPQESFGDR